MEVLRIDGLAKSFGNKQVLKRVDLAVPEGSIFGFIGSNGAGKTTTMKCVLGLLQADEGRIEVMGERVAFGQTPTNRHIGYLPDVPDFYGYMTAKEYLVFCGRLTGQPSPAARADELLKRVGLEGEKGRIKGYSRGMKQRLGVAQALFNRPKLLVCDEPTSALDPVGRKEILDILREVRSETTVLFSTHVLSEVEKICTDVAFLDKGSIRCQGKIESLKSPSSKGFFIELSSKEGAEVLKAAFPQGKWAGERTLSFFGTLSMQETLRFCVEKDLTVERAERETRNLESLFLEGTEE